MTKKDAEISAIEAARQLGVGLDYLYGLVWAGKLTGRKIQNRWRVSAASVNERLTRLRARQLPDGHGQPNE